MEQPRRNGQDHAHVPFGQQVRHQASGQDRARHRHVSAGRPVARVPRRRRAQPRLCEPARHAQEGRHVHRQPDGAQDHIRLPRLVHHAGAHSTHRSDLDSDNNNINNEQRHRSAHIPHQREQVQRAAGAQHLPAVRRREHRAHRSLARAEAQPASDSVAVRLLRVEVGDHVSQAVHHQDIGAQGHQAGGVHRQQLVVLDHHRDRARRLRQAHLAHERRAAAPQQLRVHVRAALRLHAAQQRLLLLQALQLLLPRLRARRPLAQNTLDS